jgi:meso-butanediol dehydrogenase / (S,S)-butanediol dehydrogenase / diacetyl reductase
LERIVVITGAGAGLGRAFAHCFGSKGDRVVLLGRTLAKVEQAASEIAQASAMECDVSSAASVEAAFARISEDHGKIDVLINNAATYEPFRVAQATDDQIMAPALTNFVGPILTARAAIPLMQPGSQIISISSESAVIDYPMLSLYESSKAGFERFSHALGKELKDQGIRVTTVRAGSMYDEHAAMPAHWNPQAAREFHELATKAGIDLRGRPKSHFRSVAEVVHGLTVLPADVTVPLIQLDGFKS